MHSISNLFQMIKKHVAKNQVTPTSVKRSYNASGKSITKKRAKNFAKWKNMSPEQRNAFRNAKNETRERQEKILNYLLSCIFKYFHLRNERVRWTFYKFYMFFCRWRYILMDMLKINGTENLKNLKKTGKGVILFANHIGKNDVNIVLSILSKHLGPISFFADVGDGYFAKVLEKYFDVIPRVGDKSLILKKCVNTIKHKNKYFGNCPEGTVRHGMHIVEPFSGIIRVYEELNRKNDRIPIIDVVLRGSDSPDCHRGKKKHKNVIVDFSQSYFIPRSWLYDESLKKSPREIINTIMSRMNKRLGYDDLAQNLVLEQRRNEYDESKNPKWKN